MMETSAMTPIIGALCGGIVIGVVLAVSALVWWLLPGMWTTE